MVTSFLRHLTVLATDGLILALFGLVLLAALAGARARAAEVAPPPRAAADCHCPDGDLRCQARAALHLQAAKQARPIAVPEVMPDRDRRAARAALVRELKKQRAVVPVIPPATPR